MKVVLDTFYNYQDDIFEDGGYKNIIGGSWMGLLHAASSSRDFKVLLASTYLRENNFSEEDIILSEGYTRNTKKLLATQAVPFIIFSGESPNVDWKLYSFLNRYTQPYKHAILFSGAKKFVAKGVIFHPFLWPNNTIEFVNNTNLNKVRYKKLVMVVSNKKQSSTASGNLKLEILKKAFLTIITKVIPSLKLKDLYKLRMDAIVYFSQKSYFDLFGKGWDNTGNLTPNEKQAIKRLKPTVVDNKAHLLTNYTFALCFENCIYPGYITEKIFDCFFSGCIPIYYGTADITNYVPANTFINAAKYDDLNVLHEFLENITSGEILEYKINIQQFLTGAMFKKFTDHEFCNYILALIERKNHRSN